MEGLVIDSSFWKGRRVFMTGHTGFKGGWLSLWLNQLGAKVTGYALKSTTTPALYEEAKIVNALEHNIYGDIRDIDLLAKALLDANPEIVIHMAAQTLVKESYADPSSTYSTNIMGTVNLYEAIRKTPSVKVVLNITTDKCYENTGLDLGYLETDRMGGHDPYSSSKGSVELISSAYRRSFFQHEKVALATARSGNVIGGGDWAKNRIIPDAIRAFLSNKTLLVRNPVATRPWQHVLEPLMGYIILCQQLTHFPKEFSEGWNFGANKEDVKSVSKLVDIIVNNWGDGMSWRLDEELHPYEARILRLDCSKAEKKLNWKPIWHLERALDETTKWYKAWNSNTDMHQFSLNQIETYQQEYLS